MECILLFRPVTALRGIGDREMPPESQEIDGWTRKILRAVEPDLRRHLGHDRLDEPLVSDLYLAVRKNLTAAGLSRALSRPGLTEDLAMTIYMVSVSRSDVAPALLASVTRTLEHIFQGPTSRPGRAHSKSKAQLGG